MFMNKSDAERLKETKLKLDAYKGENRYTDLFCKDDIAPLLSIIDRLLKSIEIMSNQMECGCEMDSGIRVNDVNDCTRNLHRELKKAMEVMK